MIHNSSFATNSSLFRFLNSLAGKSEILDTFFIFCAHWLPYWLVVVVIFLIIKEFWKEKGDLLTRLSDSRVDEATWKSYFQVVLKLKSFYFLNLVLWSVFLARGVITEIIRYLHPNGRPFIVLDNLTQLLQHDTSNSFPSGHAATFFALATAVYFYEKQLRKRSFLEEESLYKRDDGKGATLRRNCDLSTWFFLGAILISISRVIAGIHWPADILAGAIVGIFSGWFVHKIFSKFFLK